ncbi:cupredoxin domain-containing protein [Halovivax gelatinilyticus]|uniref:cupredoxin domain-containing protein n=1 Tax=Halovivax gelatinilyticus TaxID=2961597 RepID=UPI0020CA385D|nr:plastocyanin/azurin family copper-binding protein [Halovivax gelatinilyticus]
MRRRAFLATGGSAGLLALSGCTAVGDAADALFGGAEYDIGMSRNAFDPERYEATVGERVVWKNTSESVHTITAYESSIFDTAEYFASGGYESEQEARDAWHSTGGGGFDTRETYAHTFETPGEFPYCCIPHEFDGNDDVRMVGTVVVTE